MFRPRPHPHPTRPPRCCRLSYFKAGLGGGHGAGGSGSSGYAAMDFSTTGPHEVELQDAASGSVLAAAARFRCVLAPC